MDTFRKFWTIIIALVIILSSGAGCKGYFSDFSDVKSNEGFRTLTVNNELCSFSMEYPESYKREGPYVDLDYVRPYTDVHLLSPKKSMELLVPANKDSLKTVTSGYVPASFLVEVYDTRNSPTVSYNANGRLENDIVDNAEWENFELLERLPVTVSGMEGELIAYVVDWFIPIPRGEGPLLQYHQAVYFDHNGLIWVIEATAEMGMVDQVKADFEHILKTFKIMD